MAHQPDGMGADRYRERQNMKAARHTHEPRFDIIALDFNGDELYETDSADTEEEARDLAAELNSSQNDWSDLPDEVARFSYRKREDRP